MSKTLPCITPYRLKDKKGSIALSHLIVLKTMSKTTRETHVVQALLNQDNNK
jgi:hypothetical protein